MANHRRSSKQRQTTQGAIAETSHGNYERIFLKKTHLSCVANKRSSARFGMKRYTMLHDSPTEKIGTSAVLTGSRFFEESKNLSGRKFSGSSQTAGFRKSHQAKQRTVVSEESYPFTTSDPIDHTDTATMQATTNPWECCNRQTQPVREFYVARERVHCLRTGILPR